MLTKRRQGISAQKYLIKAIENNVNPELINIDKSGANKAEIKLYNRRNYSTIKIRQCKYLNNIVEQDHRVIKWRYFNPIGAHQSGLIGELPNGIPNNLMPYITQTAVGLRDKLSVYGNDYPTKDGTPIRDYIHVVDLAKAHVKALERQLDNKQDKNFEIFNLGTGNGYSVMEVIKTFEEVSKMKLNFEIVQRRDGDVPKLFANANLAEEKLNWKAEFDLKEMIASAWKWEQKVRT